jgi:hypothetical protein
VFLDEAVFTFNTFSKRAWYKKYSSISVIEKKLDIKPVAFIAAISEDQGLEQYLLHPKSISQDQFIHFIHQLSEKYNG